jgi:hypothetical protein
MKNGTVGAFPTVYVSKKRLACEKMDHKKKVNIFLKNIFGIPPILIKESRNST